jgi:hypothetical protein
MQSSRSDGKSGTSAVLGSVGKALVWGSILVLAINANVPKRLIELYRSLSGGSGTSRPESIGSGAAPKEMLPAPAGSDDVSAVASGDVGTEGLDAAGYQAPDAQGLILMDDMADSDRQPADAGMADISIDRIDTADPSGWTVVDDSDDVAMEEAGLTGDTVDSDSQDMGAGAARGFENDPGEHVPALVAEDHDAVPGDGTTECPPGFPIKGNGRSRLYHVPEGSAYEQTKPEVCFRTPEAAEKAGFRRAKG